MITEERIEMLLCHYHQYQIEMAIIKDCSDVPADRLASEDTRYTQLKQKTSLVDHWFSLISKEEGLILRYRYLHGESWQAILNMNLICDGKSIGTDRRTLQRTQKRGIQRIFLFMNKRFGDSLDHLFTEGDSDVPEMMQSV